jgi:hypothetical protein
MKRYMLISSRIGTIWKYKDADHIKIYINVIGQKMIDALGYGR